MKAVYFEKPGEAEVLKYGDFSTPKPDKGEALIKVEACALNYLDIWMRKGLRGLPIPHILGSDVSGVLEEINGESRFEVGQEVVINPAIPCGACSRCEKNESCELVKIFGKDLKGGYAEYTIAPIEQIYPKPKNLSFTEAAAFPLTFLTAWHMLITRAQLKEGETAFIWGASGGLGSSAIQIAKATGAKVIVTTKSSDYVQKIKEIGADEVVVYSKENVNDFVNNITNNQGVDVVFESVGEKTWNTSLKMLRPYGRLVIAGTTSGDMGTQDLSDIYVRQLTILGARMGTREEFESVLQSFESGKLKPIIDKVFPLKDAATAHKRMEERQHMGKIILEV